MTRVLPLLTVLLLVGADEPAKKADPDEAKLQGGWVVVSTAFNGNELATKPEKKIVFEEKKFTAYTDGKKKNSLSYRIDSSKKPKQIELRREGVDEPSLGVYTLEGDELKLCYGEPGAARPTKLAS